MKWLFGSIFCLLLGLGCAAGGGPTLSQAPPPQAHWAMEGGRPERTYRSQASVSAAWRTRQSTRFQPVDKFAPQERSGAIVVGGVAYIGHSGRRFEALRLRGEKLLWSMPVAGRIYTTAAYAKGLLVFGDDHGNVTAVDLAGATVWTFRGEYPVVSSPLIAEGKVFVPVSDQNVFCLDLETGEPMWQYGRQIPRRRGLWRGLSLCYGDQRVFAGFADGSLVALDAELGRVLWRREIGGKQMFGDVSAGPAYADGRVYAASFSGPTVCIESASGDPVWSSDVEGSSGIAVGDEALYLGTPGGDVVALNRETGKELWRVSLDGGVPGPPVLAGRDLVVGASAGSLYVLSAQNGETLYRFRPGPGVSAPALVDAQGILYLSNGGVLHWQHGGGVWD